MKKTTTDAKVLLYKSYEWSELDIISAFRKIQSRLTQFQKVEGEDSFASIHVAEAEANSYNIRIHKGAKKASSYPIYNRIG
ncbi:hypothetical protein GIB67_001864, partial [Kingdonia uniflora]